MVLVARMPESNGPAAPDISAACCAWAKRDVDVEIVRVVMNAIGVADGVRRMESLANFPITFLMVDCNTRSGLIPTSTSLSCNSLDMEKTSRC